MRDTSRRRFLTGAVGLLGGTFLSRGASAQGYVVQEADADQVYGAIDEQPFPVPAVNLNRINPDFLRAVVDYPTDQPAGSIVIDPAAHYLYLIHGDGQAIRYGVGVGREGFLWSGNAEIKAKRVWPDWYPPKEMVARDPHVRGVMQKLQSGLGMPGGPGNPLGARAMYLFQGNKDTLYRIHGTVEPWTIGSSVSSGCIRMINQDVIDLFNRVPVGTKVLVLGSAHPSQEAAHRPRVPDPAEDQYPLVEPAPDASAATQPYSGYAADPYAGYRGDPNQGY
ncbi:L,D-transpeptidase [Lichenifustis flavocetrariae]|uniref:L,D-transpeptidase n=1 Tax=Lichenifustis flavocetrariae TaxID=2949735 RepID=UPI0031F5C3CE